MPWNNHQSPTSEVHLPDSGEMSLSSSLTLNPNARKACSEAICHLQCTRDGGRVTRGFLFLVGMAISCCGTSPHAVCGLRTHRWGLSPSHASSCQFRSIPGRRHGKLLENGNLAKGMPICCCNVPCHLSASPQPSVRQENMGFVVPETCVQISFIL